MEEIRVSDIIRQFSDLGHIPEHILQNKAEIGTRTHTAIDLFLKGDFYVLCPRSEQYFNSYVEWHKMMKPKYILQEKRYYDMDLLREYNSYLTGQVDGVILLDNQLVLIDYKTSVKPNHKTWPLQGHFYKYLLEKSGQPTSDDILFLKLCNFGGMPKPIRYKFDLDTMSYCLDLARNYAKERFNVEHKSGV